MSNLIGLDFIKIAGNARSSPNRLLTRSTAKFAPALIRHIYDHAVSEGWLKPGDSVVDPFGGVALGALHAMRHGLTWCGCELEPRFVALAEQNIALWNRKYSRLPRWGTARIVQGDSRKLCDVIGETVGATISSPPYAESLHLNESEEKQHARLLKNGNAVAVQKMSGPSGSGNMGYGSTPGNLGNLPARAGDFDAAVGSPPFCATSTDKPMNDEKRQKFIEGQRKTHPGRSDEALIKMTHKWVGYPDSPGQLGAMRPGDVASGVISSPPFMSSDNRNPGPALAQSCAKHGVGTSHNTQNWIPSAENLAGDSPDTFWSASRTILEQVHTILRPGGKAIWVLKAFVKNKQIVDFPGQWQALCESVGFRTLHVHRAWLVEDHGVQLAHDGNHKRLTKARKSFFRRLSERRGSPAIDWEIVLCTEKPA